jgi:hypothetical protein
MGALSDSWDACWHAMQAAQPLLFLSCLDICRVILNVVVIFLSVVSSYIHVPF